MSDTISAGVVPHQVLTAASHELRGPLGVARGYLRLLASAGTLDERGAKMVTDASRAAERMAELLDELSQYARWARGEQKIAPAPALLNDLVVAAAKAAQKPAAAEVRFEIDAPGEAMATVDRTRLGGAWTALITAVARAQVQDAAVLIRLRLVNATHAVLQIGPKQLFDQPAGERAILIERGGAGLSLALAELVVQRHGGRLVELWRGEQWGYACYL